MERRKKMSTYKERMTERMKYRKKEKIGKMKKKKSEL